MNLNEYKLWQYVSGFALSVALTLTAYLVVAHHTLPPQTLIIVVVLLAALQFIVQMMCFLHIGRGASSRERLTLLGVAALIVAILVGGSLWIMSSLNARMMPSQDQMQQYMDSQTGI